MRVATRSRNARSWVTTMAARPVEQQLLEALDAVDVEVVGRLVQQQQARFERKGAGERRALALPAGQPRGARGALEAQPVQVLHEPGVDAPADAVVVDGIQRGPHRQRFAQGRRRGQFRLLPDRDDSQAAGFLQDAVVERDTARDDFQQ